MVSKVTLKQQQGSTAAPEDKVKHPKIIRSRWM